MKTLEDVLNAMPEERRREVEARTEELLRTYSLRQVREAVRKTQKDVAAASGIGQENVSRIEGRSDMLVSTLSDYVKALGGRLVLVADMPGGQAVEIQLRAGKLGKPRHRNAPQPGGDPVEPPAPQPLAAPVHRIVRRNAATAPAKRKLAR